MSLLKRFYTNIVCSRVYCIMLLVSLTALSASPLLQNYVGRFVKVAFVWGAFIVLRDLALNRALIKNRYSFWLFLFCVGYAFSILIAAPDFLTENVKQYLYMALYMVLLFGNDITAPFEKKLSELQAVANTFIAVTFAMSLTCIAFFLFSADFTYYHEKYGELTVGLHHDRFGGLYNPNTGSTMATITVFVCWMMLVMKKRPRPLKAFYIAVMVLQYVYLLLTQSRTAWYTLLIFGGLVLFVQLLIKFKDRVKKTLSAALLAAAAVVVLVAGAEVLRTPTVKGISYLPSIVQQFENVVIRKGSFSSELIQPVIEGREDMYHEKDGDVTSGRVLIWKASLEVFKEYPVFGVTREGLHDRIAPYLSESRLRNVNNGGLHNIYLTVLVCAGLVGFALLAVFVFSICKTLLFKRVLPVSRENLWQYLLMAITFSFFLMEFFESRILFRSNVFSVTFWVFTGYLMYFAEKDIQKKDDSLLRKNWVARIENRLKSIFQKKQPA